MEEPLPANGACLLGSLNLSEFVKNKQFNWDEFQPAVSTAVSALNDVLDEGIPLHPLSAQRDMAMDWRQIGLGIFGLADMLIKMELEYGSEESIQLCDNIGRVMAQTAITESQWLAVKYGAFPMCDNKNILHSSFYMEHMFDDKVLDTGMRNSQLLTIAPTGSLSNMIQVSGGIEPIYDYSYIRKTESLHGEDKYYKIYTPIVKKYMEEHSLVDESELPDFFITAKELDYKKRIKMQSTWQSHIDASISSTVNLPESATVEDVFDLYMMAYEYGLKGVTVFRDNCERAGILTADKLSDGDNERGAVKSTPDNAVGKKRKLMTGCGTLHCLAFFDPVTGDLLETYLAKGSTGGCNNFMIGLSRMVSLAARSGTSIDDIVDQLSSTGSCPSYTARRAKGDEVSIGSCCPSAVGYALVDMHNEMMNELNAPVKQHEQYVQVEQNTQYVQFAPVKQHECPQCGSPVAMEGGCMVCKACGYSKCD